MAIALRRACALAIAVAIVPTPRASCAPPSTVSARADREGVILESPRTNAAGESNWAKVCTLPCERVQTGPSLLYRVTGPNILTSDPFDLRGYGRDPFVEVHAKTTGELGTARGLLYGGLAGVAVGAALLVPGVILMANGCRSETNSPCMIGTGAGLAFAGGIAVLAGTILVIVGGVSVGNCDTTVTIATKPPETK